MSMHLDEDYHLNDTYTAECPTSILGTLVEPGSGNAVIEPWSFSRFNQYTGRYHRTYQGDTTSGIAFSYDYY